VGSTRGQDWKLFKKRFNLDAGKFSFGNKVCDEWNKLPRWVANVESFNECKGNSDHYLRDTRGFKYIMLTLSPLEPCALSGMLSATVLGKLGKFKRIAADHLTSFVSLK